jgi:hypothetical protein
MKNLSFMLGFKCFPDSQRRFGVGGIFAESNCAFRGRFDTPFSLRERVRPLCPAHGTNGRCKEVDESGLSEGVTVLTCGFWNYSRTAVFGITEAEETSRHRRKGKRGLRRTTCSAMTMS